MSHVYRRIQEVKNAQTPRGLMILLDQEQWIDELKEELHLAPEGELVILRDKVAAVADELYKKILAAEEWRPMQETLDQYTAIGAKLLLRIVTAMEIRFGWTAVEDFLAMDEGKRKICASKMSVAAKLAVEEVLAPRADELIKELDVVQTARRNLKSK